MSQSSSSSTNGIGLAGGIFIGFLILKLCGVIHWSWWWVTSPLWIAAMATILILGLVVTVYYIRNK